MIVGETSIFREGGVKETKPGFIIGSQKIKPLLKIVH